MTPALRAYIDRNKKKQLRNVAEQPSFNYSPDYRNVSQETVSYEPSIQDKMRNQVGDKESRRVPVKSTSSRGSGRTVAQANAEAQDPMYEFRLDQGIINSQGEAQSSLQDRMRNQTPEFLEEKDKLELRRKPSKKDENDQILEVEMIEEPLMDEDNPVLEEEKTDDYQSFDVINFLSDLFTSPSSPNEGMLSKRKKERERKLRSGRIAWGKGR